ncbi:hypothetical protein FOXG_18087 [Fusarium oxysporum f. sp. lycopersici 4287]|uniref:Uncharacterized protein n=2 Tax=Fusarium oxysporum TaxID=5507 RepID=A0A0J9U9U6_FUSO4|nr:hypothetical protein FOXG_18087 [Fusarium oxysporum f. sp. lycopersici 4287]KNA96043.1 hypothetical protein FOXG_18087 [Fusarium oxysporum f. sp. lycopersici 4287]
MPESALEKLMFQWNLGHPNVSYAELKPNFDQHEQNVEAAVSILKTPHARQSFLSECRNNRSLTPAWSELLKDLEQLANRNTQSLSSPQDERYLSVNHFIFDRKTFKIKAEEDPKFPSIIVLQGGHSCGFEEAISKLFSVSLGYVSLGYVSLGEHSRKQMMLTMAPRKPGDWAQERLVCKPCRFVASSKDYFVSHNISSHPEKKNPELYDYLICGKGLNINSRQHKCGVSSREIRFGTRDLFMVYWLKFMEIKVDKLRDLLSVWDDLRSPVCSEFRKYLSSRLAIKNPTKPDLIYPLCVLLRRAIRSQEKKENPCLVLQNLIGRTKVSKRTLNILNFIFDVALREQTFLNETRKIHGMQEELEAPKVVGEFGVDILRGLESRYHPEWEQSTEAYGYHRFRSSPMGNAQREAIHVQNQSHEEGTSFNPVDIPSDEDTDSVNGIEALIDGEDAMSSVIAPRNELGQAESESWFSRGFYLGRELSQAEGNIDDEHDGNNNDENNNYNNGDGSEQRLSNPESSSDQNNGYIDGLKEEHRYYRFINDIDLEAPIEKLKELEKGLTERHLEDLNRHHFDDIDLNLRNLISLKGALKALLETREAVEKSIPKDFSLEWSDQMVDGIDLKTPTEQLKKLKESMDEKQCEDVRCGRYNNLALNAGKLTRFARAMERFVPASERVQEVLATWKSHTS